MNRINFPSLKRPKTKKTMPVANAASMKAAITVLYTSLPVAVIGMLAATWAANNAKMGMIADCGKPMMPGDELSEDTTIANTIPLNNARPIPADVYVDKSPEKIIVPKAIVLLIAMMPIINAAVSVGISLWGWISL
jgi:hypothetical protein